MSQNDHTHNNNSAAQLLQQQNCFARVAILWHRALEVNSSVFRRWWVQIWSYTRAWYNGRSSLCRREFSEHFQLNRLKMLWKVTTPQWWPLIIFSPVYRLYKRIYATILCSELHGGYYAEPNSTRVANFMGNSVILYTYIYILECYGELKFLIFLMLPLA